MTGTFALIRSAQSGDRAAGERLVQENAGLIWSVVRRYDWGKYEPEDLYQLGCLGFLKAVEGFDPEYGTQFSTYAVPKIAGEIRRFLRDDGPVKVSRGRKEQALLIQKARRDLTACLGREPVLSELSAETGLTPEDIAAADLAAAPVASLQAQTGEDGGSLEELVGSLPPEEGILEKMALHTAIRRLPDRERKLISLRYFKGLTQVKTAKILGVSQVQVSRLEKKAIAFLRWQLESG